MCVESLHMGLSYIYTPVHVLMCICLSGMVCLRDHYCEGSIKTRPISGNLVVLVIESYGQHQTYIQATMASIDVVLYHISGP